MNNDQSGRVSSCDHPADHERVDVFTTAVPPSHPGYSRTRRVTCTKCGRVVTTPARVLTGGSDPEPDSDVAPSDH